MLDQIFSFFKFLIGLFQSLPKESQDEIKGHAVDAFDGVFRKFFRQGGQQGAG